MVLLCVELNHPFSYLMALVPSNVCCLTGSSPKISTMVLYVLLLGTVGQRMLQKSSFTCKHWHCMYNLCESLQICLRQKELMFYLILILQTSFWLNMIRFIVNQRCTREFWLYLCLMHVWQLDPQQQTWWTNIYEYLHTIVCFLCKTSVIIMGNGLTLIEYNVINLVIPYCDFCLEAMVKPSSNYRYYIDFKLRFTNLVKKKTKLNFNLSDLSFFFGIFIMVNK